MIQMDIKKIQQISNHAIKYQIGPKRAIFWCYLTINKDLGAANKKPCFPPKNGIESRI